MSLNILIGHEKAGQRAAVKVIYCGESGSELEAAHAADRSSASFTILKNPLGIRKSNPAHDPKAEFKPAAAKTETAIKRKV